jgi:hypothetical protein
MRHAQNNRVTSPGSIRGKSCARHGFSARNRVSAFRSANIENIRRLKGDLQGDLIRRGIEVHDFNQRNVAGILDTIAWSA